MPTYSIKELEQLTGIKAHTIRAWEQRYAILNPSRTSTNIRSYSESDLKYLTNVALLNKNGHKISHIVKMSHSDIDVKTAEYRSVDAAFLQELDVLTAAMLEMDAVRFETIMDSYIAKLGLEATMAELVYPFMEKLVVLWMTNSIDYCQQHFTVALIRQKIIAEINKLSLQPSANAKRFVLFLPTGEQQEVHLLFIHFLLKQHGHVVCYLGVDVEYENIKGVEQLFKPDYIFTLIHGGYSSMPVSKYLTGLKSTFSQTNVLVTGPNLEDLNVEGIVTLSSLSETNLFIESL